MNGTRRRCLHPLLILIGCVVPAGSGCSIVDLQTADRLDRGRVVILPGIEGRSRWNLDVARGRDAGGGTLGMGGGVGAARTGYGPGIGALGVPLLQATVERRLSSRV